MLLLAVSGGIDSMYMAERALEDFGALFPSFEPAFAVVHCNFSLRGAESDADEEFVRQWCTRNGIECIRESFDTRAFASSEGISIEMAARQLRYDLFARLCAERGFRAVAVAHNADDNAETLLLNLLRGCGSRGLRGMSADSGEFPRRVLRPLLGVSRRQIREWMLAHSKQWREDSSNSDISFRRNRLRHEVLPVFEQINPSALSTLAADMERFRQVDDIAEDYYRRAAQVCVQEGIVDLRKTLSFKHWEYLLYRFTQGRLNADGLFRLKEALRSGRPLGGKIFGPYKVVKGKLTPMD